ncbi:hypothetical protein PCO82_22295 [Pectobacteriaceae bacterium CE90]|nr:hypothetical protein [Prodigiosinella sp. LS101]WJV53904.1 hypothetical protein PCO85_22765 [Prodigiosinella sp. LS101]WJV58266.1 hypothetical protein PCO84_22740 [Pectobacteriaceae bacterium C111]WJY15121.1 hypothetical protein PCO82_22295 [Pectobacteriaceae bacterium CE90]
MPIATVLVIFDIPRFNVLIASWFSKEKKRINKVEHPEDLTKQCALGSQA